MFSVIISVAMNMLQDGDLPLEKIAKYSGFTLLSLMIGKKKNVAMPQAIGMAI